MTNTNELKAEMVRNGDTGQVLSKYLGITHPTFSNKLNNNAEFTQEEIYKIKVRYGLSCDRVDEIFLIRKCLIKAQKERYVT